VGARDATGNPPLFDNDGSHDVPLVRTMCALVVANPYSGKYVDDMSEMFEASQMLGRMRLRAALPQRAAIIGPKWFTQRRTVS
jgi:hypothetical protein